jgi:hypothetical protein
MVSISTNKSVYDKAETVIINACAPSDSIAWVAITQPRMNGVGTLFMGVGAGKCGTFTHTIPTQMSGVSGTWTVSLIKPYPNGTSPKLYNLTIFAQTQFNVTETPVECTSDWKCDQPLNGTERDGCGQSRHNDRCTYVPSPEEAIPGVEPCVPNSVCIGNGLISDGCGYTRTANPGECGVPVPCTSNWKCEQPLNGYMIDGCGDRKPDWTCVPDPIIPEDTTTDESTDETSEQDQSQQEEQEKSTITQNKNLLYVAGAIGLILLLRRK